MLKDKLKFPIFSHYGNMPTEIKIICIYRYFSLLLTSLFSLTSVHGAKTIYSAATSVCLCISSFILNYLYIRHRDSKNTIKLLVVIETLSNVVILIPTGGLKSPYIWYSLNTVLVTAYLLDIYYICFNIASYIIITTIMSVLLFDNESISYTDFLISNSNLILGYILIIGAVEMLVYLDRKLNRRNHEISVINEELLEANKMINESVMRSTSFYSAINGFININDKDKLAKLIISYVKDISKSAMVFSYMHDDDGGYVLEVSDGFPDKITNSIASFIKEKLYDIAALNEPYIYESGSLKFAVSPIKSSHELFGVLGILLDDKSTIIERENIKQLEFLSSLSSIIIERLKIDDMNRMLLIAEEQNRIANEIHDSVMQKLFYISCKVGLLIKSKNQKGMDDIIDELKLINESLRGAMKELREEIYGLSYEKNGNNYFEKRIESYIDEASKLNDVNISFNTSKGLESVNYDLKRVIYRIISEGLANAICHSGGKNLNVSLKIERAIIKLEISDDGVGFDLRTKLSDEDCGLGIKNLYNLVNSLNGDIKIDSRLSKGTSISVILPNKSESKIKQGEAI